MNPGLPLAIAVLQVMESPEYIWRPLEFSFTVNAFCCGHDHHAVFIDLDSKLQMAPCDAGLPLAIAVSQPVPNGSHRFLVSKSSKLC